MQDSNPRDNRKIINRRIWSLYNESLVRRTKGILYLKDIKNYKHDLRHQNMKKNGRLFILPNGIFDILARIMGVFNASFGSLESYLRIYEEMSGIPGISYSSIFRSIGSIKAIEIMNASSSVAVDSNDIEAAIRENGSTNKRSKKRNGQVKLCRSTDIEMILAFCISITIEKSHDTSQFSSLLSGNEQKVYADGVYDSRKILNTLGNNGTEAIIPLRKNLRTVSRGPPLRGKTAGEIRR